MSRFHRAMEKADREGLLTLTRPGEEAARTATLDEPAIGARGGFDEAAILDEPARADAEPRGWEMPPFEPAYETPAADEAEVEAEGAAAMAPELLFSPLLVAASDPESPAAEEYRLLRTRLESRDTGRRTQLLLITSPRVGEGKTTTSANLALTMSREFQNKVVLVEADLRRPTLAARFGIRSEPGLVEVLAGAANLDEALVTVPGHSLVLLPAGLAAPRSTELLASSLMQRVVDDLRRRFDRVILDTPPVTLADTHVLARIADGLIIVVRAGVTTRPAVESALAGLDRQKLLGIVLNEVEDKPEGYGYGYPDAQPQSPQE
jgi:succinoglycan biosynthesis transport protein ExoP